MSAGSNSSVMFIVLPGRIESGIILMILNADEPWPESIGKPDAQVSFPVFIMVTVNSILWPIVVFWIGVDPETISEQIPLPKRLICKFVPQRPALGMERLAAKFPECIGVNSNVSIDCVPEGIIEGTILIILNEAESVPVIMPVPDT